MLIPECKGGKRGGQKGDSAVREAGEKSMSNEM